MFRDPLNTADKLTIWEIVVKTVSKVSHCEGFY
jgi:hypothetical protein